MTPKKSRVVMEWKAQPRYLISTKSVHTDRRSLRLGCRMSCIWMTRCQFNSHYPYWVLWKNICHVSRSTVTESSAHVLNIRLYHHGHNPTTWPCRHFTTVRSEDAHQRYLQQIRELEEERVQLLGEVDQEHQFPSLHSNSTTFSKEDERRQDLEARFHFTQEDYQAWTNVPTKLPKHGTDPHSNLHVPEDNETLTHWDASKEQVTMVDVSSKNATQRHAVAQSIVLVPIEAMKVLMPEDKSTEIHGPKGPIFATARIAGEVT
jgi:hypothetical protein